MRGSVDGSVEVGRHDHAVHHIARCRTGGFMQRNNAVENGDIERGNVSSAKRICEPHGVVFTNEDAKRECVYEGADYSEDYWVNFAVRTGNEITDRGRTAGDADVEMYAGVEDVHGACGMSTGDGVGGIGETAGGVRRSAGSTNAALYGSAESVHHGAVPDSHIKYEVGNAE